MIQKRYCNDYFWVCLKTHSCIFWHKLWTLPTNKKPTNTELPTPATQKPWVKPPRSWGWLKHCEASKYKVQWCCAQEEAEAAPSLMTALLPFSMWCQFHSPWPRAWSGTRGKPRSEMQKKSWYWQLSIMITHTWSLQALLWQFSSDLP